MRYSTKDLADRFAVSNDLIRYLAREGMIPAQQVGGRYFFGTDARHLMDLMQESTVSFEENEPFRALIANEEAEVADEDLDFDVGEEDVEDEDEYEVVDDEEDLSEEDEDDYYDDDYDEEVDFHTYGEDGEEDEYDDEGYIDEDDEEAA